MSLSAICFGSRRRFKVALRLAVAIAAMGIATPSLAVAGDTCVNAELDEINFGLAFVMTRQAEPPRTHGHPFSNFSATAVRQSGDQMEIDGIITGSGEIGPRDITIRLLNIAGGNPTIRIVLWGFVGDGSTPLSGGIFASYDDKGTARSGDLARVSDPRDLTRAQGEIHDYATTVLRSEEWLFSGQWFLDCRDHGRGDRRR